MKKIMFNDEYGLTDAVLKGRKTMTRRFIKQLLNVENPDISDWGLKDGGKAMITLYEGGRPTTDIFPMYQPGEVVAVAQRYSELSWDKRFYDNLCSMCERLPQYELKGWDNKMFVRPDLMPHQIRITNIKVERLQDISDEDCMCEGVVWDYDDYPIMSRKVYLINDYESFLSPRLAFAALVNRICGKSTWELNPYVFAYSFELVK